MYKLSEDLKTRFRGYVDAARGAATDLRFLFDNLGVRLDLDCSEECFEALEDIYWKAESGAIELPEDLMSLDDLIALICRYLGQCIVDRTGGKWVQSTEKNRRFGHPCVDGFGNKKWERIYPVELAQNFRGLVGTNPSFPGVRERRVLARQFQKAMGTYAAST